MGHTKDRDEKPAMTGTGFSGIPSIPLQGISLAELPREQAI